RREWILSNGIGGYAMGAASGMNTRRYHGLLIAATTPPTGRMLLLAAIDAFVESGNGNPQGISSNQYPGAVYPEGIHYLRQFSVDHSANWRYRAPGIDVERTVTMASGRNTVTVSYKNVGEVNCTLILRPVVCHRDH